MADAQRFIDIEAFSYLKQAIVCFLINFEQRMGLPANYATAIGACEAHFNFWGPTPNQSLGIIINQCAANVVASH